MKLCKKHKMLYQKNNKACGFCLWHEYKGQKELTEEEYNLHKNMKNNKEMFEWLMVSDNAV